MNAWIDATENLPTMPDMYIVTLANTDSFDDSPKVTAAFFEYGEFVNVQQMTVYDGRYRVTHWQSLPDPPTF